jgi:asparagine synthase (glutamine-hydrolysing)
VALSGVGGDSLLLSSPNFALNLLKTGKLSQLVRGLGQFVRLRRRVPPVGFRAAILRPFGLPRQEKPEFPLWLNPDLVRDLDLYERWRQIQEPQYLDVPTDRPEAFRSLTDLRWSRIFETYDAGFTKIPVDVRHPLFDVRLINYCMRVPPIPWFVDKTLARVALRNRLPDEVRLRPKAFGADAVAVRLPASPWVDSWKPAPELSQFVVRSRVPILAAAGAAWDPHHRPFLLNQWLFQLTLKCG